MDAFVNKALERKTQVILNEKDTDEKAFNEAAGTRDFKIKVGLKES